MTDYDEHMTELRRLMTKMNDDDDDGICMMGDGIGKMDGVWS